jgi:Family of unknown function (DUF6527)
MKRRTTITHEFVEYIPERLDDGIVYGSIPYTTIAHKCFCGCGHEVITPLSPTDWRLTFDGVSISLDPSIGNWSFACQSHYFIRGNVVHWAGHFTNDEIDAVREHDRLRKAARFDAELAHTTTVASPAPKASAKRGGLWRSLVRRYLNW